MKVHEPLIVILIIIIVQNTIQSTNIAMEIGSFGSMFYLEITSQTLRLQEARPQGNYMCISYSVTIICLSLTNIYHCVYMFKLAGGNPRV